MQALRIYLPLLLVGASAGLLQVVGRRAPTPRQRRLYQILWILTLLVGAPVWLLLAAALGWL